MWEFTFRGLDHSGSQPFNYTTEASLSLSPPPPPSLSLSLSSDAAPPSYFHLFPGRTAKGSGGRVPKGRRRRRHTQSRRPRVAALREDVIVGPLRRLYRRMNKTAIGSERWRVMSLWLVMYIPCDLDFLLALCHWAWIEVQACVGP